MKMFRKLTALALCLCLAASLLCAAPVFAATAEEPDFLAGSVVGYVRGNLETVGTNGTNPTLTTTLPENKTITAYAGGVTLNSDGSARVLSRYKSKNNASFYLGLKKNDIMSSLSFEKGSYENSNPNSSEQFSAKESFVVEFDLQPVKLTRFSISANANGTSATSTSIWSSENADITAATDFIHFVLLWNNDDLTWSVWKDGTFVKTVAATDKYTQFSLRLTGTADTSITADSEAYYDIKNIIVRKATLKTKYEVPTITTGETLLTMGDTVEGSGNSYYASTNVDKQNISVFGSNVELKDDETEKYVHMEMRTSKVDNSRYQLYWKAAVGGKMGWDSEYNTTSDFVYEFDVRVNNTTLTRTDSNSNTQKSTFGIFDFTNAYLPSSNTYPANKWNHVKIAYDCSEKTFYTYMNGVLVNVKSNATLQRTDKTDAKDVYLLNDFRIQIAHNISDTSDGSYIDLKNFSLSKAEITFEEPVLSVSKVNLAKKATGTLSAACNKHSDEDGSNYKTATCGVGAPTYSMEAQVTYSNPTSEDKYAYVYLVKFDNSTATVPSAVYAQKVTFTAGSDGTVTTSFNNTGFDHTVNANGNVTHNFTHLRAFVADEDGNLIPFAAPAVTSTRDNKGVNWIDSSVKVIE